MLKNDTMPEFLVIKTLSDFTKFIRFYETLYQHDKRYYYGFYSIKSLSRIPEKLLFLRYSDFLPPKKNTSYNIHQFLVSCLEDEYVNHPYGKNLCWHDGFAWFNYWNLKLKQYDEFLLDFYVWDLNIVYNPNQL